MSLLRRLTILAFACLVLVSSTNFMVGMHHCGGHLKHVALFDKAAGCEMEQQQVPPCHRASTASCCDDVTVVHEDEDFSGATSLELQPAFAADALATSTLLAEIIPAVAPILTPVYHPPLLAVDRPVALGVFLI